MDPKTDDATQDGLTTLLFRLPAELRHSIYSYAIPSDDVLLVPSPSRYFESPPDCRDFRWLSISRRVFLDAAPLVYTAKPVYFAVDGFTRDRRENVYAALVHHTQSAYPADARWVLQTLSSQTVKKLFLEVRAVTQTYEVLDNFLRFARGASHFAGFSALEEVYISLRHDHIQPATENLFEAFERHDRREDLFQKSRSLRILGHAMKRMLVALPAQCTVKWYMPGLTLPMVPYLRCNAPERTCSREDTKVMDFIGDLWTFVRELSDERFEELLVKPDLEESSGTKLLYVRR